MKTGMSGWVDLLFPLSKPSDQSLALFDAGFFAKACTNSKTWAQIWPHFRRHQRHLRHLLHQRNTPIFHNKHFPLIIRLFYQLIHVLLSGTPRVRIAPGTPKSLKTLSFWAFFFCRYSSRVVFRFSAHISWECISCFDITIIPQGRCSGHALFCD